MKTNIKQQLKLGLLVTAGLAFFVISVYYLGKNRNLFQSVIKITADFENVKGLRIGNQVQFSGISVGMVNDITIINDSTVKVEMAIEKDVRKFISKVSKVEIANEGLMGNKLLTINPGSGDRAPVEDGDVLQAETSVTTDELFSQAQNIIRRGEAILTNLENISKKLDSGDGDFARFLNDDNISTNLERISQRLVTISYEMEEVVNKANSGEGDISKLLNKDNITSKLDVILRETDSVSRLSKQVTKNLLQASQQINHGNGIITKLLRDSALAQQLDTTMVRLNQGIDEAKEAAQTVESSWVLNVFSKEDKEEKQEKEMK